MDKLLGNNMRYKSMKVIDKKTGKLMHHFRGITLGEYHNKMEKLGYKPPYGKDGFIYESDWEESE